MVGKVVRSGVAARAPRLTAVSARRLLRAHADPVRARHTAGYFKTGKGEYGEGDRFIGVTMPQIRALARTLREMPLSEIDALLGSPVHEDRVLAVVLLGQAYDRGDEEIRDEVFHLYLARTDRINNWDLVDMSAPGIVGRHLVSRPRAVLHRLADSPMLWERRIAMLATMWFLREGETAPTLKIATKLRNDPHDLMHKAVGWLLREAAKRDKPAVVAFLRRYGATLPRTLLRYAIEHFPAPARARFLAARTTLVRRIPAR